MCNDYKLHKFSKKLASNNLSLQILSFFKLEQYPIIDILLYEFPHSNYSSVTEYCWLRDIENNPYCDKHVSPT